MKQNKFWSYISIGVLVGISVLSLIPPKSGVEIPSNDKINHFIAYSILSVCCLMARFSKRIVPVLLFCIAYGILMELVQGMVPGREQSILDILANISGVFIGWGVFRILSVKNQ
ncbi:MAG: VanZ family protein [Flavobacteriales bacterium]